MSSILSAEDSDAVAKVVSMLRSGQVVGVPTDTVYGLAVDPMQTGAVERIFALKDRPSDLPLPVLVSGWDQVEQVAGDFEVAARGLADRFWPGPLTLVVPRRREFSYDLGGRSGLQSTVGLRWPDHAVMQSLCRAVGPLAVTSANRHGLPPASTAREASEQWSDDQGLAAVLDGGLCDGVASTVVECRGATSRCLREGGVSFVELRQTLQ